MTPSINIIGGGNVGRVFGRLFARHQVFRIQDVLNRSIASAERAVAFIGAGRAVADFAALRAADITMLTVGDDQIAACCAALAERGYVGPDAIVFHCSGALTSQDLARATQTGAAVASLHPIRSFADPAQVADNFTGTYCSLEGDPRAQACLTAACAAIGAVCVPVNPEAKTLYHAASVFASNYLVSLVDVALRAYVAAGIPEAQARQLAQPLIYETLDNIFRLGPPQALSGPIARGDLATVAKQQSAVDTWDQEAGNLYRALITPTTALARRKPKPPSAK